MTAKHLLKGALLALTASATQAQAQAQIVNVPAGTVEDVALELARQVGCSIIITDRDLAKQRVQAIRGRLSAAQAIERLSQASGARAVAVGTSGWRLVRSVAPLVAPRATLRLASTARAMPPPALAPADPIIVVSSKRDLTLKDYPGQVTQIAGEDLAFGGVGGTDRVAERVAAVSTTHLGSGRNKLFIRGIADSSFNGPTLSTVGQYLGDLRLSYNSPDPDLRLADMSSVEVLEGPQGTLYGSGSLGGIVRMIPNPPDTGQTGAAMTVGGSVTAHGSPGGDISAMLNLPLAVDKLALRLVANGERQGGYIDKPLADQRDVNRTTIRGARGTMRLAIDPAWGVDVIGVIQATRGRDSQYADRNAPPLTRNATISEPYEADYAQAQLVVTGRLGDVRVRSSTGIMFQDLQERYDASFLPQSERLFVQGNRTRMIANETRLWMPMGERTGWILGSSFTRNETRLRRELGAPDNLVPQTGVTNRALEYTVYGEGSVRLWRGIVGTLGGRVTSARVSGEGENLSVPVLVILATRAVTSARIERVFLPTFALSAQATPDTVVSVRYQEGFRPGGLAVDGDLIRRFQSDRSATYELLARHFASAHGGLELSAGVSYTDWRGIQADYIDSNGRPTTANIGDGKIWTFSLSGKLKPAPGLSLDAGVVHNFSRVTQPYQQIVLSGEALTPVTEIPNVADWAARIGFDYRRPLGRDLDLRVEGMARYVGRSRLGIGPQLGGLQGDYVDSSLTVRIGKQGLGMTLGASNLVDARGNRFALGTPFTIGREHVTPQRPTTVRLGFDATF